MIFGADAIVALELWFNQSILYGKSGGYDTKLYGGIIGY